MPTYFCLCQCKICRAPGGRHCSGHPSCGVPAPRTAARSTTGTLSSTVPDAHRPAAGPRPDVGEVTAALARLKARSGSHSPSVAQLERELPGLVSVDACYLSNPYATVEVMRRLRGIEPERLERMVSHYPSQAAAVAATLAPHLGLPAQMLHLANGASEVIRSLLAGRPGPVLLSVPTFSAYHELADGPLVTHQLSPKDDFRLDLDALEALVYRHSPQTLVLINPNNPDGGAVPHAELAAFVQRVHGSVGQIIVDESFSHFATQGPPTSLGGLVPDLPRLVVVNSLSKSYGIAGLRLGYAVMAPRRVRELGESALWNLNAFAEWFCELLGDKGFAADYERARRRYVRETKVFFDKLGVIPGARTYPTSANFALVELDRPAAQVAAELLARHGVYVRDCADKRGLDGERYLRVASRTAAENALVLDAFRDVLAGAPGAAVPAVPEADSEPAYPCAAAAEPVAAVDITTTQVTWRSPRAQPSLRG